MELRGFQGLGPRIRARPRRRAISPLDAPSVEENSAPEVGKSVSLGEQVGCQLEIEGG